MPTDISNDFFHCSECGNFLKIDIHGHYLGFEQLSAIRELKETAANRSFVISGKSSVEAYFILGYMLTLWHAASLVCLDASGQEQLNIHFSSPEKLSRKKWFSCYANPKGENCLEIISTSSASGQWSQNDLQLNALSELPEQMNGCLHISGRGSVWMYMHLGISIAHAGLREVLIAKPSLPFEIKICNDGRCEAFAARKDSRRGIVVGILGDPNSGKSVFSRNFAAAIRNMMPQWHQMWIYDCDLASPTPEWYLKDCDATKNQREAIKQDWSPELEEKAAADLHVLRQNLDITLADMPGGKRSREDGTIDRIPSESRGAMMAACDVFIVLCQEASGDAIFKAWQQALAKFHLEKRIIARLESAAPKCDFHISPLQSQPDGFFSATICGLDRRAKRDVIVSEMERVLAPLIQYISYIRVARDAQAACAKAFLTDVGGTRYGAAVRSASSGRIFTGGQYSSFNHSTNIHAEMNVLSQAASAGEPDIDVLAIACSQHRKAVPCGVCRQVMQEHMQRTSRDFSVVLVNSDIHFQVLKISELLPSSWMTATISSQDRGREFQVDETIFPDKNCEFGASCWEQNNGRETLSIVWDPCITPHSAVKKIKYILKEGVWSKLPHAFTQGEQYQKYLTDHHDLSTHFPQLAMVSPMALRGYHNPRPLNQDDFAPEQWKKLETEIFASAGIHAAEEVFLYSSRLLNLHRPDSDYDLIVRADSEKIKRLRKHLSHCLQQGILQLPVDSGSIRYLQKAYPHPENIVAENRYCESLLFDGIPLSLMFVPAISPVPAFSSPPVNRGRREMTGIVMDDTKASFKRSETLLQTVDGEFIRLLCYHKLGTLLQNGDHIAVCGTFFEAANLSAAEYPTLLLANAFTDKIVWME